jgi:hypothetical protein
MDGDVAADAGADAETTDPVIAMPVARNATATRGRPLRCLVKMATTPLTVGAESGVLRQGVLSRVGTAR